MPSRRSLHYRQAGKAFNEVSRITPARANKSPAVTLVAHLSVVHCTGTLGGNWAGAK